MFRCFWGLLVLAFIATPAFPAMTLEELKNALCNAAKANDIELFKKLVLDNPDLLDSSQASSLDDFNNRANLLFSGINCGSDETRSLLLWAIKATSAANTASKNSPLIEAIEDGDHDTVCKLIETGADVNVPGEWRVTALHCAVQTGNAQIVSYLLKKGADPSAVDSHCDTPLSQSVSAKHNRDYREIVELLVRRGADVNHRNIEGSSAIHIYAGAGRLDIVRFLVANGAEINSTTLAGGTPLMDAAFFGSLPMAEFLLANGADINAVNRENWSALSYAVYMGRPDLVKLLCRRGANHRIRTSDGVALMDMARSRSHMALIPILESYGAH